VIRQLDPGHPLLNDKRLPIVFGNQVRSNIEADHLALATALLTAGLQFAPTDPGLLDLQDRISHQQNAAQLTAQTAELEQAVRPLDEPAVTLADFRTKRTQMELLRAAQPASAVLISAQNQLARLINPIVATAVAQRQITDAQATVNEFADLLPAPVLAKQRADIGSVTGNTRATEDATVQLRAKIEKELASFKAEDAWVNTLKHDLQSLEAMAGSADPAIAAARTRTSQAFLEFSKRKLSDGLLSEAQRTLDLAREFGLAPDIYQAQVSAMNEARTRRESDERARASASKLLAAKQGVLDQAGGDNIDIAKAQFAELQKTLPASDPFVTTDAPRAIAEAYIARAHRSARQAQFDEAYSQAQAARQAAPNLPEFNELMQRFLSALELARSFNTVPDYRPSKPTLDRIRDAERSTDHREIQAGLLRLVTDRINRVAAQDLTEAGRLRDTAVPLFPSLAKLNLTAPRQQAAPGLASLPPTVPPASNDPRIQTQTAPQATPQPATSSAPVGAAQTTQTSRPKPSRSQVTPATQNDSNAAAPVVSAPAPSIPAGPCSAQTFDTASRIACRDTLKSGGPGPEMVIIPAGGTLAGFAMMKNEASNADYNTYCTGVKGCKPIDSDPNLPVSSVSVDDAQKYAIWLSAATGARYRLPTDREWLRAAGRGGDPDANCVGGQAARGTALRATTIGSLNDYGLRNVMGNVQEWAITAAGGLKAMGGAIGDSIQICQTEFSRPSSGQPDTRTGFRLLREMR
jgi:formylglycine-generating enzyme required for sulfatase activity